MDFINKTTEIKQINIDTRLNKKIKALAKCFNITQQEMMNLAINYAYTYKDNTNKNIPFHNMDEDNLICKKQLKLHTDIIDDIENGDDNYYDLLQYGMDLLYEQNMIKEFKNNNNYDLKKYILGTGIITSALWFLFMLNILFN